MELLTFETQLKPRTCFNELKIDCSLKDFWYNRLRKNFFKISENLGVNV